MSENGIKRVHVAVCWSHLLCLEQQIRGTHFAQNKFEFLVVFPSHCLFCAVFLSLSSALVVTKKPKGVFSLPLCSSDWSFLFAVGLKTYLISGQKVKEPQCSCSQALLPGLESADGARTPGTSAADSASDPSKANKQGEKPKVSCAPTAQISKQGWGNLMGLFMHCFTYLHMHGCVYIE